MKPALTPEEWAECGGEHSIAKVRVGDAAYDVIVARLGYEDNSNPSHALAALALHGQPFGFTREDVRFLLLEGRRRRNRPYFNKWRELALRIETLLPPEETPE